MPENNHPWRRDKVNPGKNARRKALIRVYRAKAQSEIIREPLSASAIKAGMIHPQIISLPVKRCLCRNCCTRRTLNRNYQRKRRKIEAYIKERER